jgi:hypothetical protein
MPSSHNAKLVSHIDCPGGGQVWVEGNILYIGHMEAPSGTSIVDIADPLKPRLLARLDLPQGWHSHKVRAKDGVMIVNHEAIGEGSPDFGGGLAIYDVSQPSMPKLITKWKTDGAGVHRYDFDGRYAYVSATVKGFVGNIPVILDLADPAQPTEVSHWWIPGQWKAGGEEYPWDDFVPPRCHHPLRAGNRLNVSYWHHGLYILDISDLTKPKLVAGHRRSPAFPHPTHTCLAVPQSCKGRRVMVVADEDVAKLRPAPPAFAWIYDITEETLPTPIATINVAGVDTDGRPQPQMTGCHQPSERFSGSIVPFAWFAQGLRFFDIADPFAPREVGYFKPDPPAGSAQVSSNDVTMDHRGLIYLIDRMRGVDVIETSLH